MIGKRTVHEMEAATGITRNAIDKRIKKLGIKPIDKIGLTNFYSEEDYQKFVNYKTSGVNPSGKINVFYAVSVEGENGSFYVKHAGISKNKATLLVRSYKNIGKRAYLFPCKK